MNAREKAGRTSTSRTPHCVSASRMGALTAITRANCASTARAIARRAWFSTSQAGPSPECSVIKAPFESRPAAADTWASIHDFAFAPFVWRWIR